MVAVEMTILNRRCWPFRSTGNTGKAAVYYLVVVLLVASTTSTLGRDIFVKTGFMTDVPGTRYSM